MPNTPPKTRLRPPILPASIIETAPTPPRITIHAAAGSTVHIVLSPRPEADPT